MSTKPTPLDLTPIRARLENTTPAPWEVAPCSDTDETRDVVHGYAEKDTPGGIIKQAHWIAELDASIDVDMSEAEEDEAIETLRANADFIAHARTDIPALLAEVARLRTELTEADDRAERYAMEAVDLTTRLMAEESRLTALQQDLTALSATWQGIADQVRDTRADALEHPVSSQRIITLRTCAADLDALLAATPTR